MPSRINPFKRDPAPPAFGAGKTLPEVTASWFSRAVFQWISPFMSVGFSRPLETDDLWGLANKQLTEWLTDDLEQRFLEEKRIRDAAAQAKGTTPNVASEQQPDVTEKSDIAVTEVGEDAPPDVEGPSLMKTLYLAHRKDVWISGCMNLVADTLQTTTPLVSQVFLSWLVQSYTYGRLTSENRDASGMTAPRGIGYGIAVAFGIFLMQEGSSLLSNLGYKIAMAYGQDARSALIGIIFRKSLRISGKARIEHNTGQIITMVSTDATNVEQFAGFAHQIWIAPIQLVLAIALLIKTLGYSALVGLGLMIVSFPLQGILVYIIFAQREKAIKITDKRVQLTSEVLQGIRLIKCYGWETFYLHKISELRGKEVKAIRKSAIALAGLFCLFNSIPVLAAVLSFITYSLTGHVLNVAVIFAALQLFNVLRMPLLFLPLAFSALSSAMIALKRMSKFLAAEELADPYLLSPHAEAAVSIDGDFSWEAVRKPLSEADKKKEKEKKKLEEKEKKDKNKTKKVEKKDKDAKKPPTTADASGKDKITPDVEETPFELNNLQFSVPRGSFVAIVGRIGSGKSSLLQALIGEMKKTRGNVVVSGSISYVPQSAWIQNTSLRENITFGLPDDEKRFCEVVSCCNLDTDIAALPHGEATEIGEKGINLSGGQKARISLARAVYSPADIILLDDPLSAVDAHVGKSVLENCILSGPLAGRTRILITHALHVLDKTDRIFVMENGSIVEQGSYEELVAHGGTFTSLIEDFGQQDGGTTARSMTADRPGRKQSDSSALDADDKAAQEALMQLEERNTGAVGWEIYRTWLIFAGGLIWVPILGSLLGLSEAITVGTNLWLSFWTSSRIADFTNGQYIAVYAGFGMASAFLVFVMSFAFFAGGLIASLRIFKAALTGILRSPLSFFDTTPMGRILSRLSKDQETLDNELASVLYSFLSIAVSVFGVMALVFYTFPYLGIAFAPLAIIYYTVSLYYRASSVEAKRLDSILRSSLYATVSESLTGLATIRAYGAQGRSLKKASQGLDMQNRAYYMTLVIQRWLAIRLDFFGNMLVLGIGLFAAGFRDDVNPASIGVVLTYTLSFTMIFSEIVAQFAQTEQNMNAVERVVHYTKLDPEGDSQTPNDPPPSWPSKGEIVFDNVQLAYRQGLPLVLKGVTFRVKPLEKIGIVGRTGAGKSSLLQALFRTVELPEGTIEIDGVNISKIGLDALRSSLALVPQDSVLFMGTLRENLDPQGQRTDFELISALQRVSLVGNTAPSTEGTTAADDKFRLDALVGDEGANYSAGEKQLLAMARAIVRNNRVIVLDEATSNVDVETDAKVQRTIRTEFSECTLLCIAHRLNTIAFYDRVLVMNNGRVAEFDTVLNLYDNPESIFRALCDEANLSRFDILKIREDSNIQSLATSENPSKIDIAVSPA